MSGDQMAPKASDATGHVTAVHLSAHHEFSKSTVDAVTLVAGLGVEGDAHLGATVKHRSRVARDPTQPNLRQVHLVMSELLDELRDAGHDVAPGQLGENITTAGIDLIGLPVGSTLRIGDAILGVTGLRNPCKQIHALGSGVLQMMFVDGTPYGRPGEQVGRAGIMAVVLTGGTIGPGATIDVSFPAGPHIAQRTV